MSLKHSLRDKKKRKESNREEKTKNVWEGEENKVLKENDGGKH